MRTCISTSGFLTYIGIWAYTCEHTFAYGYTYFHMVVFPIYMYIYIYIHMDVCLSTYESVKMLMLWSRLVCLYLVFRLQMLGEQS